MKERMILAKELLKEDGVIFVSLNDNMYAYFKVMMDEIFGEENFVSNLFWQSNNSVMKRVDYIRNDFEFILCYSKNKSILPMFNKKENKKMIFENIDNDPNGEWFSSNACKEFDQLSNNTFEIVLPNGTTILRTWRFSKQQYLNNEIPLYFKDGNVPRLKIYKKDYKTKQPYANFLLSNNLLKEEVSGYDNLYDEYNFFEEIGSFSKAKNELKDTLNNNYFSTPKPVKLIKFLINLIDKKDVIVLDFFAGSGTTGHAVLELNKEDDGNREFILCTREEIDDYKNNIATDYCYERLYRINNGKTTTGSFEFEWLKKNEPYFNDLDVYRIKDIDISIDKQDEWLNQFDLNVYRQLNKHVDINADNAYIYFSKLLNNLGEE